MGARKGGPLFAQQQQQMLCSATRFGQRLASGQCGAHRTRRAKTPGAWARARAGRRTYVGALVGVELVHLRLPALGAPFALAAEANQLLVLAAQAGARA